MDRTIDSGQAFIQGLYPIGTGPSLREDYNVTIAKPPFYEKIPFNVS